MKSCGKHVNSPPTAQSLGVLLNSARDILCKDKGLNGDFDRLPMPCSAAVPGCGFRHRLGGRAKNRRPVRSQSRAHGSNRRRDTASTRRRGRLRYVYA